MDNSFFLVQMHQTAFPNSVPIVFQTGIVAFPTTTPPARQSDVPHVGDGSVDLTSRHLDYLLLISSFQLISRWFSGEHFVVCPLRNRNSWG